MDDPPLNSALLPSLTGHIQSHFVWCYGDLERERAQSVRFSSVSSIPIPLRASLEQGGGQSPQELADVGQRTKRIRARQQRPNHSTIASLEEAVLPDERRAPSAASEAWPDVTDQRDSCLIPTVITGDRSDIVLLAECSPSANLRYIKDADLKATPSHVGLRHERRPRFGVPEPPTSRHQLKPNPDRHPPLGAFSTSSPGAGPHPNSDCRQVTASTVPPSSLSRVRLRQPVRQAGVSAPPDPQRSANAAQSWLPAISTNGGSDCWPCRNRAVAVTAPAPHDTVDQVRMVRYWSVVYTANSKAHEPYFAAKSDREKSEKRETDGLALGMAEPNPGLERCGGTSGSELT